MIAEQKNKLAKLYFEIGETHGRALSKDTLITLVNSFDDLDFNLVFKTMNEWLIGGTHFPLPAHIRQKIMPTTDESDEVLTAINRAFIAAREIGFYNSDKAKKYIGELGWEIIQCHGGWENFCTTEEPEGVIRAQMKYTGVTVWKRSKRGERDVVPKLPEAVKIILPKMIELE